MSGGHSDVNYVRSFSIISSIWSNQIQLVNLVFSDIGIVLVVITVVMIFIAASVVRKHHDNYVILGVVASVFGHPKETYVITGVLLIGVVLVRIYL